MTRSNSRVWIWLERLLLIAGLAGIAIALWFLVGTDLIRRYDNNQFDKAVTKVAEAPKQKPAEPPPPPEPGALLARLSIPRVGVKSIVREGAGDSILSAALGHIKGTALPGENGNVAVAGHRDTLFRGLRHIAKDDEIIMETPETKYVYQVKSTEVVEPTAMEVLQNGTEPELTLVTCYPFNYVGAAPKRFIVKARLVDEADPEPAEAAAEKTAPVHPVVLEKPRPVPARRRVAVAAKSVAPKTSSEKPHRITFTVRAGRSRELVPGKVWFGVSRVDTAENRLDGWIWIAPLRRTVWLRDENTSRPVTFRDRDQEFNLVLTKTSSTAVSGYLATTTTLRKPKPLAYVATARR